MFSFLMGLLIADVHSHVQNFKYNIEPRYREPGSILLFLYGLYLGSAESPIRQPFTSLNWLLNIAEHFDPYYMSYIFLCRYILNDSLLL